MRLFVALQLPVTVRRSLVEAASALRPALPPARWVPAENLHLTLRFLGEIQPGRVAGLGEALATRTAAVAPFRLRLRDGGCFPPRRPARVVWVGFEPSPQLLELQRAVASAVEARLGLPAEGRPFHPHLTLARPRRPWPRAAVERWCEGLAGARGPAFEVEEIHLMRSRLGPAGARHDSLAALRLGASRGVTS